MKKRELLLMVVIATMFFFALTIAVNADEGDYETAEGNEFSYVYNTEWEVEEKEIIDGVNAYIYTLENGFAIHLAEIGIEQTQDLSAAFSEAAEGLEFEDEGSQYYGEMMFYLGYGVPEDVNDLTSFDRMNYELNCYPDADAGYCYFKSDHLYWRGVVIMGEENIFLVGADCTNSTPADDAGLFRVLVSVAALDHQNESGTAPSSQNAGVAYEISDVIYEINDSAISAEKRLSAIIEITNTGDVPIYLDDCILDFEDDDGHLLQTFDFVNAVPAVVQPGDKGYFYTNAGNKFDSDVSFENGCNLVPDLTIKEATGTMKSYEVVDTSIYNNNYGSVGCKGRVVNETDKEISLLSVGIVYYDGEGKVLGISNTSLINVKADGKTSFDDSGMLLKGFTVEDVAEYVVYATEVYYQIR